LRNNAATKVRINWAAILGAHKNFANHPDAMLRRRNDRGRNLPFKWAQGQRAFIGKTSIGTPPGCYNPARKPQPGSHNMNCCPP
jgi:hypothetical protein